MWRCRRASELCKHLPLSRSSSRPAWAVAVGWFGLALALILPREICGADIVAAWNNALLDSIRTDDTPPCQAARSLAIVHGSIYDAGVTASSQGEPFFYRTAWQSKASPEAAMNSAALAAAKFVHPSQSARFDALYRAFAPAVADSERAAAGELLGRKVAQAWIEWRSADGISKSLPYIPKTEAGAWKRTPPFFRPPDLPAWRLVQPFVLVGSAQFRPPGPPALESARYAEDLNAIKAIGGAKSAVRTPEQTETARFWSDFSYSVTPPGHWNQVAQQVTSNRDLQDKARIFAILNITLADVGVACWDAKYHFNFWRPVTAIRAAETDGNPATEKDPEWSPLLVTPAFPEYVSGHSAFSGAAARVLASLAGGDALEFTVPSDTLPGKTRSFHSLKACAAEVSQSRAYGGIHFPSALQDGLILGERIADHVLGAFARQTEPVRRVFAAPIELEKGYWVGGAALPGEPVAIEQLTDGKWQVWTNLIAESPMIRWKAAEPIALDQVRIVLR